jgi:hypothetical protein
MPLPSAAMLAAQYPAPYLAAAANARAEAEADREHEDEVDVGGGALSGQRSSTPASRSTY